MNTACRSDNNSCCCCKGNGSGFGSAIEGLLFGLLLYIGIQQAMMGMMPMIPGLPMIPGIPGLPFKKRRRRSTKGDTHVFHQTYDLIGHATSQEDSRETFKEIEKTPMPNFTTFYNCEYLNSSSISHSRSCGCHCKGDAHGDNGLNSIVLALVTFLVLQQLMANRRRRRRRSLAEDSLHLQLLPHNEVDIVCSQ